MSGLRCLVVDDHDGFRATARRLLESIGWTVVGEAPDGAGAIAAVGRLHPDVVLLDVGLPDLDGFAVAQRLATGDGPAVVLISSRDRSAYGTRIASSPAIGFIAKGDLDEGSLSTLLAGRAR